MMIKRSLVLFEIFYSTPECAWEPMEECYGSKGEAEEELRKMKLVP
jgi:hypothetical protein